MKLGRKSIMNVFFESSVCCDIEKEVVRGIDYKCRLFIHLFISFI